MLDKIKNLIKHPYIKELRDVRSLGLVAFGVIVLLVSWSGVRVIETNYQLEKDVARLEEQNTIERLENQNQALENEYYRTDQYLELQARKNLGKAAPGETVVLVPEEVALAHTVEPPHDEIQGGLVDADKPFFQENFEAWTNFFLNRASAPSSN